MPRPPADFRIDQFSALSHKEPVGNPWDPGPQSLAPSWVPAADLRRLAAYKVRAAYLENVARFMLSSKWSERRRDDHREYGDVAAFVDRAVASILGDGWSITVDGAAVDVTDPPETADRPADPAGDASPLERTVVAAQQRAWDRDAQAAVDAWVASLDAQGPAMERQDQLRLWAERVELAARLDEGEHDSAGLGDGTYVLWPQAGDWPTVQVMDPGFYFPDLESVVRDEFPPGITFAWDLERTDDAGQMTMWVRRLQFRLVRLNELRTTVDRRGNVTWIGSDGGPLEPGQRPPLAPGETLDTDGVLRRKMPWTDRDGKAVVTEWTCVVSDGIWPIADVGARLDALDDAKATWSMFNLDLGVPFVTVVHVPNTSSGKDHFGRSVIDRGSQLLDDIAQTDTRIMGGSQYLGAPVVSLKDASLDENSPTVLMPGQILSGDMKTMDLSAGIERLGTLRDDLRSRWRENQGAPGELFGAATGEATSGIHLALRFGPWASVVAGWRLARMGKHPLLFEFAQKLAMVAGVLPAGPVLPARITYGPFLPFNVAETVKMVGEALAAHAVSTQTAVSLLVAAGFPIDDARAEVERILAENTKAAFEVAEALAGAPGAERVVAERLGVADQVGQTPVAPAGPAPSPTLPPVGA